MDMRKVKSIQCVVAVTLAVLSVLTLAGVTPWQLLLAVLIMAVPVATWCTYSLGTGGNDD